jgi:hypothetical protein
MKILKLHIMPTGYIYYYCHKDHCYVGSTFNLNERKYVHKQRCYSTTKPNELYYNNKFYVYFRTNTPAINDYFEVLETIEVEDNSELIQHEQNYIDIFKSSGYTLLNINCAFRTPEEKKEKYTIYHKEYGKQNRKHLNENWNEWFDKNKELKQCTNCQMFIFGTNSEMNAHRKSNHCLEYKDRIKQTDKYVVCDKCNSVLTKDKLIRHKQTKKCEITYNILKNI